MLSLSLLPATSKSLSLIASAGAAFSPTEAAVGNHPGSLKVGNCIFTARRTGCRAKSIPPVGKVSPNSQRGSTVVSAIAAL
eukprot:scaffold1844_cov133-Isochrysis_galbana.AAC.4